MSRRYIVIASPTKRGLIYLIYDTLNQVSIESGYGCENGHRGRRIFWRTDGMTATARAETRKKYEN